MSDPDEPIADEWRSSPGQAGRVSTMVAPLAVLPVAPALGGPEQAAVTVGLVLAEAIALYVGYGALTRIVSSTTHKIFVSD